MTTVFVRGLEFYAHHGVPDEEQAIGHRYRVDIEFEVEQKASESDAVADSVDYAAVALLVQEVGTSRRFRTLERLSSVIAQEILRCFPRIRSLKLRIEKPFPPAPVIAASVGVEREYRRE